MKKIMFVVIVVGLSINVSEAQTWNEWFRQKKTQKQYLIQQIAALKVYMKYLKEGYDIARKGLNLVGDIKDGNFKDHSTYFESLLLVNSSIRDSPKVALIVAYQMKIINEFRKLQKDCRKSSDLSKEEIQYVENVYSNILTECETIISALNRTITDNASQLKDDERIERIDLIYEDMKNKHSFAKAFCNSTQILIAQRFRESHEIDGARKLNSVL